MSIVQKEIGHPARGWDGKELRHLRGLSAEWAEPGHLLFSRGNTLYEAASLEATPRRVFRYPTRLSIASRFRPAQRALRLYYYNVLKLSSETFLTFAKSIGVVRNGEYKELNGVQQSCRVLRGACATSADGSVYFGEYWRNLDRTRVNVYRYQPGNDEVEIVHTFDPGEVRHVHGVYRDPYDDSLWCLTGDLESECRILRTCDGFRTLETVGQGDETWRAVSILFSRDAIYYGMDAEFRTNHVYRIEKQTGQRTSLGEVDGPIYYSNAVGNDLFFGVKAEMCPSQTGREATIWHVDANQQLSQVVSYTWDGLGTRFMGGIIHFPSGPGLPEQLLYHGVGLQGAENRTFSLACKDGRQTPNLAGWHIARTRANVSTLQ